MSDRELRRGDLVWIAPASEVSGLPVCEPVRARLIAPETGAGGPGWLVRHVDAWEVLGRPQARGFYLPDSIHRERPERLDAYALWRNER